MYSRTAAVPAFTRSFISSAGTDDELAILTGLLDSSVVWPGLAVDTDLRWSLIQRLVTVGRFGDTEIDPSSAAAKLEGGGAWKPTTPTASARARIRPSRSIR